MSKKKVGVINLDPREWIVQRRGRLYYGIEYGPRSKAAFMAGDRRAIYTTVTIGFAKPHEAADELGRYLKAKEL